MSATALADGAPDARQLYSDGEAAFGAGRFLDAARAFEAAYAAVQRHELLWNIAQSYRRQYEVDHNLSHLRRAVAVYRNYVDVAPSGEQPEAREAMAAAEATLRAEEKRLAEETRMKAPAVTLAPVPQPPSLLANSAPSLPPRTYRKRWIALGAVGGVVVLGAVVGITAGVLLRNPGNQPPYSGNLGFGTIAP